MKSILKVLAGDFTAKVLLGLAGLALIRFMSPAEYAVLTLATVVSAFVVQGVTGNLNQVYLVGGRQLGLDENPQAILNLQLWLVVIFTGIAWSFADRFAGAFWWMVALTAANCLLEFAKTFFQKQLRFGLFSLLEVARTVVFVGVLIALIVGHGEALTAKLVLMAQSLCVSAVVVLSLATQLTVRSLLQLKQTAAFAKTVFGSRYIFMMGYFLAVAMLVRVDVMMLESIDTEYRVAVYGASLRYYNLLMMLLGAVHTVFLPLTQRVDRIEELTPILKRHQRLVMAAVPVILAGAVAAVWLIPWINGGRYPESVAVYQVLSLSAVISLACSPYANLMLRYGQFRYLFVLCTAAVGLNLGLNALLIPRLHAVGAAWGTLISAGLVNAVMFARSRSLLAKRPLPDRAQLAAA